MCIAQPKRSQLPVMVVGRKCCTSQQLVFVVCRCCFLLCGFSPSLLLCVWIVQLLGPLCRGLHIFLRNKQLNALMDLSRATLVCFVGTAASIFFCVYQNKYDYTFCWKLVKRVRFEVWKCPPVVKGSVQNNSSGILWSCNCDVHIKVCCGNQILLTILWELTYHFSAAKWHLMWKKGKVCEIDAW